MYLQIKYNFQDINVVGHDDIAPNRKIDPSHYFRWDFLAYNKIGYYPQVKGNNEILFKVGDKGFGIVLKKLEQIGYPVEMTDTFDSNALDIVHAFKRRYCPDSFFSGH